MVYDALIKFMAGEESDPKILLKDVELLVYATAKKLHLRLNRVTAEDVRSTIYVQLLSESKPIQDALVFMEKTARRLVYASCKPGDLPLGDIPVPPVEPEDDYEHYVEPIVGSALDIRIKEAYVEVLRTLSSHEAEMLVQTRTVMGELLSAAMFIEMGRESARGPSLERCAVCKSGRVLPMSGQEEEVLLGCILARVNKKWAAPLYILMKDAFYVAVFSIFGGAPFRGMSSYFRNLYLSVKVYCFLTKLGDSFEEPDAVRLVSKRFLLRQRDVRTRSARIKRMLQKYDRFVQNTCNDIRRSVGKQAPKSGGHAGISQFFVEPDMQHEAPGGADNGA